MVLDPSLDQVLGHIYVSVSFTPAGDWFIFDEAGRTLRRGFRTKPAALAWIAASRRPDKRKR